MPDAKRGPGTRADGLGPTQESSLNGAFFILGYQQAVLKVLKIIFRNHLLQLQNSRKTGREVVQAIAFWFCAASA